MDHCPHAFTYLSSLSTLDIYYHNVVIDEEILRRAAAIPLQRATVHYSPHEWGKKSILPLDPTRASRYDKRSMVQHRVDLPNPPKQFQEMDWTPYKMAMLLPEWKKRHFGSSALGTI
jgi:hypothetical protein